LILDEINHDRFCPSTSGYKHSFYYPFIYFIFKVWVRNAEAIGLRVGSIEFNNQRTGETMKLQHSYAYRPKDSQDLVGHIRVQELTMA